MGSEVLTFDVEVLAPGAGIDYLNVAEVTAMDQTDSDSTPGNDDGDQSEDDEDSATIDPQLADVSLTKDVSNVIPNVGDVVTFTITVDNAGPSEATGVSVADQVPSGYASITNISAGGGETGGLVVWPGLVIPSGGSVVLTFDAEVLGSGDYKNTAEVTAMDQIDSDSTPDNDDGDQSEDDEDSAEILPNASISGTVFEDINDDDTGDSPISGVLIELKDLSGSVVASTNTDANGIFEFLGITPGDYILMQTDLAGYQDVSDEDTSVDANDTDGADGIVDDMIPVTLTAGEADADNDFVEEQLAGISGSVTEDLNNDDLGDSPLAGVLIELKDLSGTVIASQTTDATGLFQFVDIAPGVYVLMETDLPGYLDVSDEDTSVDAIDTDGADGIVDDMIPVTLLPGEMDTDNDFVEEGRVSIGSTVFIDTDNSGVQDNGESGIAGITVELYDSAGNFIAGTTTDANGDYFFDNQPPGTYVVTIPTPDATYNTSSTGNGGDDQVDGDDNGVQMTPGGETVSMPIVLSPGTEPTVEGAQAGTQDDIEDANGDMTVDFGFFQSGSIGDFVWFDINTDNLQDAGDPGLAGVTVNLLDVNGNQLATTTTNSNGNYLFDGLVPGDYVVQFLTPNAYTPIFANQNGITGETADLDGPNEDPIDNDADENTGMSHVITLESGENEDEVDAGFNLILEVELLSFSARYVEDRELVTLNWITSNEVNSDYFIVERAYENGDFESIGRVEAIGNSTEENLYNLDDTDIAAAGTYLYKLRQVDNDGTVNYSDVVSVVIRSFERVEPTVSLFPNPANEYINIDIVKNAEDKVMVEMFDLTGKMVILNDTDVTANGNNATLTLSVSRLAKSYLHY